MARCTRFISSTHLGVEEMKSMSYVICARCSQSSFRLGHGFHQPSHFTCKLKIYGCLRYAWPSLLYIPQLFLWESVKGKTPVSPPLSLVAHHCFTKEHHLYWKIKVSKQTWCILWLVSVHSTLAPPVANGSWFFSVFHIWRFKCVLGHRQMPDWFHIRPHHS